jgi:septum formation inhibitor-activating ATPase MinD
MMKKSVKPKIKDFTEFIDDEGKKWIQTSKEDFFSIKDLNEIIGALDKKEDEAEEILLARIDFKRVNRYYYEKIVELQERLKRKNELLRRLVAESKRMVQKKNAMLRELIEYVKQLHLLIAYYNINPKNIEKIDIPPEMYRAFMQKTEETGVGEVAEEERIEYTEVKEIVLDDEGNETGPA